MRPPSGPGRLGDDHFLAVGAGRPGDPTNWVPMPEQPAGLPTMANILAMGGAHANSMFVAAADRIGAYYKITDPEIRNHLFAMTKTLGARSRGDS